MGKTPHVDSGDYHRAQAVLAGDPHYRSLSQRYAGLQLLEHFIGALEPRIDDLTRKINGDEDQRGELLRLSNRLAWARGMRLYMIKQGSKSLGEHGHPSDPEPTTLIEPGGKIYVLSGERVMPLDGQPLGLRTQYEPS